MSIKIADQFKLDVPDRDAQVSTPCSFIGTLLAVSLVIATGVQQVELFAVHKATSSRTTEPRTPDVRVDMNRFGISILRKDEAVSNMSLLRWDFSYRGIFFADLHKDTHPRQQIWLQRRDCNVYFDAPKGSDFSPYGPPLPGNETGGKLAPHGCIDWAAAQRELCSSGAYNVSEKVELQGQYGNPSYWFVQADLVGCNRTSPMQPDIPCATEADMEAFFEEPVSVEVTMLDGLAPGVWKWSNLYFNIDPNKWIGQEMFFRPVRHRDGHRVLPSLNKPQLSTHLAYDSVFERQSPRKSGDRYVTLYFRLASTIEDVDVSYFSLESTMEGIGAWHGFIFLILGMVCTYYNRLWHGARPCFRRRAKAAAEQSPEQEPDALESGTGDVLRHAEQAPDALEPGTDEALRHVQL